MSDGDQVDRINHQGTDESTGAKKVVDDLLKDSFGDMKLGDEKSTSEKVNEEPIEEPNAPSEDEDDHGSTKSKMELRDDYVDEDKLKLEEEGLTEEKLKDRLEDAKALKDLGNQEYMADDFKGSIMSYTKALLVCPLRENEFRAVLYSNRSASKVKLDHKESAIDDCGLSLKYNPTYMKPLIRRAKLYEDSDKLDEALQDYQKILEIDPKNRDAHIAVQRLPGQINERNERLKAEMMGKLKELGNMVLRPFGLSTNNFQLQQDPNTGGYSINFQK